MIKIIVALLIPLLFCCSHRNDLQNVPVARDGVMDLRTWQFNTGSKVDLIGKWSLYWNRLLAPQDFSDSLSLPVSDGFVDIQQSWRTYGMLGKKAVETGCVTYRLLVLLSPVEIPLTIQIGRITTSFRLWVNGQLMAEAGVPGTSAATTRALIRPQAVSFTANYDSLSIVLQVANFDYENGGITGLDKFGTISIGTADTVYKQLERKTRYEAFLFGAFLVMALFQFALFLFGKNERSLVFLGIICLLMLLYTIRQHLFIQFFPAMPWCWYNRIINLPVFMLCGFFLLFFHSVYPEEIKKKPVIVLTIGSVLFTLALLIMPQLYFVRIYTIFVYYMLVQIVFMITIVVRAARHHRNSAKYIILASWVVAFATVNDVLTGYGIINSGYIVPFAGALFILMCEFGIYERFNRVVQIAKKQQEKLVENDKLASLGTLVAGVAHEINNPNNSILLSSQGLGDIWKHILPIIDEYHEENEGIRIGGLQWSQLRSEMPESVERIVRNARRIERIVTDLKAYARKDMANVMEPVDLNLVVSGSITLLENKLKNSTDIFTVDYSGNMPFVKGNFQKLEQVVINLIVNACQSLSDRSRAIRVGTAYDPALQRAIITVSDEGCGIEPQLMRQIFNPFFTTKHNSGGTGLGLSIAQSIIAGHNGELTLSSEVGVGTRATINIPVMEVSISGNAS